MYKRKDLNLNLKIGKICENFQALRGKTSWKEVINCYGYTFTELEAFVNKLRTMDKK